MQLRETKAFSVLYEHHRRVRDVYSDLDDGSRDEHLRLAVAESRHRLFLVVASHVTVNQADVQVGEDLRGEPSRLRLRVAKLDLVRLVTQRVDHKGLPPRPHLLSYEVVRRLPSLVADGESRRDGSSTSRELVKDRDVEISVDGHCEGARYRRRGHHQDVGLTLDALRAKRAPLVHSEPVLLVHDGDAEVGEGHRFLDQRVCADEEIDLTGGYPGEDLA